MKSKIELIEALNQILKAPFSSRPELVKVFQDEIWDDESIQEASLNEILSALAYDLDFYEPNTKWRTESSGYYEEEKLEEIIKSGIHRIEEYIKASE